MSTYQGGGSGIGERFGMIGGMAIEGVIIADVNLVMVQFMTGVDQAGLRTQFGNVGVVSLLGLELPLVMLFLDVVTVIVAYQVLDWAGVIAYIFGWFFIVSHVDAIGPGFVPIMAAIGILLFWESLRGSSY